MELPITSLMAALAAVALVLLSLPVSLRRIKARVNLGDGGDALLQRRIRTQANFVEYAPMAVILVGLVELAGVDARVVWTLAGALALGRALHVFGMLRGVLPPRMAGMVLTYTGLVAGAVILVAAVV